jgi:outer membrane receptor protein involved in Fe transport
MKVILQYVILAVLTGLTSTAFAQFPGGGGGGGSRGGGGFGGDQRGGDRQRQTVIPGTAEDTPKGSGKIKGILIDSMSKKPVEFAALALVDIKTNNPIDGTTTDEKGAFTMNKVASGNFKILISFIGYKTKTINDVKIDRKTELDLGSIALAADVVQLNEVEVVGMAQLIEEKVDRLVYNAEKDITSRGGDASDVMKKVPMLTVDLDGNVSLRGSSNVRVLINNKPSTIIASSVADALRQIPADMIKSVEVITSPSAKYDAEGSAGIINIVTKKSTIQGGTLNIDTGIGNRGSNLGLRGNYRTGKMGFSLGGFGRFGYNMPGKSENMQVGKTEPFSVKQSSESHNKNAFGSYNLGWDYEIDPKSSISANVRYGLRNQINSQGLTTINTRSGATTSLFRDVDTKDLSGTWDVNVDYLKTLSKPQQELSISTQFSRNNRTNNYKADNFSLSSLDVREFLNNQANDNKSHNQESTIQLDYQTPIKENQMLELGGKAIMRQVVSDYFYYKANALDSTNNLNYDQNVAAGYLSYTYSTKSRFTLKVGSRYEYTNINANQLSREGSKVDLNIPSYGNLVPSINISQTFGKGQTIKLGYNRRLQRPGIQYLNPNVNASNPQNISFGNPNLKPELTDQVELGTSFFKGTVYVNVSTFARFTNGSIESIRTVSPTGVISTTFGNIGQKDNYGVNVFGNVTLFKRWQIGGGFDSYYVTLTNNNSDPTLRYSNDGFVISGRLRTSLTIKNGWGFQGGAFMRGREIQLQGYQTGFRMYDLGLKKDFKNKRGSIGFGMENFLAPAFKQKTVLESYSFNQNNTNHLYNRGFRVNFSYKLGKMTFVEQKTRRKKSVNNDDQKSDGGGGMDNGGGGATQGGAAPAATTPAGGRPAGGAGRPQGMQGAKPAADSTARPVRQGFQGQPGMRPDSTMKRDSTFKPDSTMKRDSTFKPDSTTVRPDSTAKPVLPVTPADSTALPVKPAVPADSLPKKE